MTEKWEATEEETSIKLNERTMEKLQGSRMINGNKGWKAVDPMQVEAGELLRTLDEV